MKRIHWMAAALALALAAGADTGTASPSSRSFSYDIVAQHSIPAYQTCGHFATYNGSNAYGLDWAVNGVVVAHDEFGINYTNDGSPYELSIGEVSGGTFVEYYSEIFYPQFNGNPPSCVIL